MILFFGEVLQLHKTDDSDFKYGNGFFKFLPENTQLRYFWFKIEVFYFFDQTSYLDKLEKAYYKYHNTFLKF